jgi:S1-C subfamily serine protease
MRVPNIVSLVVPLLWLATLVNGQAADLTGQGSPFKPPEVLKTVPDFTFKLPSPGPAGFLHPGHGIADGILIPSNINSIKLDPEQIYERMAPSVMRIMSSWNAPVTEKELPLISDESEEDGTSLRTKASNSIKDGHPLIMVHEESGSGVTILKVEPTGSGTVMYYLTNCHVLGIPQTISNIDLTQYRKTHTIKIVNQFHNEINESSIRNKEKANFHFEFSDKAELVEAHPDIDLCVISHYDDGANLSFLGHGNPIAGIRPFTDLKVGEAVYAIGNPAPGATLTWSLTNGLISALRDEQKIQISAPITHGNSGGGLFDDRGNLIGIVSSGYVETTQGFNFAIAADKIWTIYGR